ncbi:HTH-type transcriptional repressor FabR [Dongshaea marina]|uniref:HTH-type transcriptional repressor FabR n=1 Tax=Dongshaea marina TaxID=2047966 RepID=UPI000D3E0580|nr:HTH-type transcriptional repressor FabR [Dongshaea marina]
MGIRAQQKLKTRRALIDAAFGQLSAERSFSSLSLREVAREAGITPSSFYRHFQDMEELGLTMVDEAGLTLRQLMRQARQRIENGGSVINTSVQTFMEFVDTNPNIFRLLLRERSGTSQAFRQAVSREIRHFTTELADFIQTNQGLRRQYAEAQADAMATIVFNAGGEALDLTKDQCHELQGHTILQLRMIALGAEATTGNHPQKRASPPAGRSQTAD